MVNLTEHKQKIQLLLMILNGVKKKKYRRRRPPTEKKLGARVELKCNNCGRTYYIWPSQLKQRLTRKNPSTLCCSVKCKAEYESIERKKIDKWHITICENIFCAKKFYRRKNPKGKRYCCRKCYDYTKTTEYKQKEEIINTARDKQQKKTNSNLFKR